MTIIESDFKIEHDGYCFVLYFLKSKKEGKLDPKEPYKLIGYYSNVKNALFKVLEWRATLKYPFKESTKEIQAWIKEYKISETRLDNLHMILYEAIYEKKKEIFYEYKRLRNQPEE